jgi:ribosomal-protein-alanine N-acetyltransferase
MKPLETERLLLRPFRMEDLEEIHRVLDLDLQWDERALTLEERRQVLEDDIRLAALSPPFGRWSMVLKQSGELIGLFLIRTGWLEATIRSLFVPPAADPAGPFQTLEVYLGYGVASAHRGQGYVTEAGEAVLRHAFQELNIWRVLAHTSHANERSVRLMQRLGMRTERNSHSNWPGIIGMIYNPGPETDPSK